MKAQEIESHLLEAVKRLEAATEKVVNTSGYTNDARKMRLLTELIKEQIRNENSMSAAGKIR
jgi:hypothetical protein